MYEYADKIIEYLNKRFIEQFETISNLTAFDELNVIGNVKKLYVDMQALVEKMFLLLAQHAYERAGGLDVSAITEQWIIDFLNDYDPITKYVFNHEVERKAARFAESLIASETKEAEIATALRYWSAMVAQYSIEVVDRATLDAYKDIGCTKVQWVAVIDGRQCSACDDRNGKVYDILCVPPKPHIGCRCYLVTAN